MGTTRKKGLVPLIALVGIGAMALFIFSLIYFKAIPKVIPMIEKPFNDLGLNIKYYDIDGNLIRPYLSVIPQQVYYLSFETDVQNSQNLVTNVTVAGAVPSALQLSYLQKGDKYTIQPNDIVAFTTEKTCSIDADCSIGEKCIGTPKTCKLLKNQFYTSGKIVTDTYTQTCQLDCPSNYSVCAWRFIKPDGTIAYSGLLQGSSTNGKITSTANYRCYIKGYYYNKYSVEMIQNFTHGYRTYSACPTSTPSGKTTDFCIIYSTSVPTTGQTYLGYGYAVAPGENATGWMDRVDAIGVTCDDSIFTVNIQASFYCPTARITCQSPIGAINPGAIGVYQVSDTKTINICPTGGGN